MEGGGTGPWWLDGVGSAGHAHTASIRGCWLLDYLAPLIFVVWIFCYFIILRRVFYC